jgi:TonB family protein
MNRRTFTSTLSLAMSTSRDHSASASSALDAYPVRIMLGLVASLGVMLALVRLPLQAPVHRVGWLAQPSTDRIVLSEMRTERSSEKETAVEKPEQAPPPTDLRTPRSEQPTKSAATEAPETESPERDSGRVFEYDEVQSVAALGMMDQSPQIVGGLGSLYLHINYPEQARRQGIEGKMELEFTVDTDGSVSDIEVTDSLHPLCDSAAVNGVRSVNFVPAKHDGTPVPIRLQLPVRFRLTAVSSTLQ